MELPEELVGRAARPSGHEPTAHLTLDAYGRLKAELDDLRGRGRVDIADKLRIAREHGDLRENAEYDSAKNEQALMEARIRAIEAMLRDPEIIESPAQADAVGPGMLVTLRPLDDDPEDEVYLLARSAEERAPGVRTITTTSPLGSALVGARASDEISYEAPAGTIRYVVVGFEPHA